MNDVESKIYRASDLADDNEENSNVIRSWERQLEQIHISEEFIKFPETKALRDIAVNEIGKINKKLLYEKNISIEERNALILIREAHEMYRRKLDINPERDLQVLDSEVENSIKGLNRG